MESEAMDTAMEVREELSAAEAARLKGLEEAIERGIKSQFDLGRNLRTVRDARLYRGQYMTFEEYCQQRWDMSRPRAYQLIDAADVIDGIRVSTNVDIPLPANEAQVRPLSKLPEPKRAEAWKEAVETAPNGRVTAAHVEKVVATRLPETYQQDPEPEAPRPVALSKGEEESRSVRDEFSKWLNAVLDGGVYTTDSLADAIGVTKTSVHWFVRMCEVSPAVIVHRNYGAKGIIQYSFQPTQCVTGHERIRQLAEQIATDPASSARAHSSAEKILALLGG
jgi:hypothetical protein